MRYDCRQLAPHVAIQTAAKHPQLKMKLENMLVPMTAEMVDEYMGPILQAARTGNLALIKNVL